MNLYHVGTTYQLLNAIVHKVLSEEPGRLLVSQWIVEKFPNYKELEKYFETVLRCEVNHGAHHPADEVEAYFLGLTGKLEQYSNIYLWAPQHSLGVYLTEKGIPFIYCEEGSGLLSRPEILENICRELQPDQFERVHALGLYSGTSASAKKKFCNVKAQLETFVKTDDIIDFDVVSEMFKLPEQTRTDIIAFFTSHKNLPLKKDSVLILTQHFVNLHQMTFDEQVLAYQQLVDYFFPGRNIAFKPHPDDLLYYSKVFEEAQVVRELFPSEFMPFIFENQPHCVATISSTGIFNLRGHYPQIFELDAQYILNFKMTHRYYAAVSLAAKMGLDIVCIGANVPLVKRLCEMMGDRKPAVLTAETAGAACVYLVDDVTEAGEAGRQEIIDRLLSLDENACAVFINSRHDYCWYAYEHKALWNHIVPVVLKKTELRDPDEDFYASMEDELLYVYSKNEELLKMSKEAEIKKDLPHVGIRIEQEMMTPEQEKIRMLEGMLAATEKRLLHYMKKEENKA